MAKKNLVTTKTRNKGLETRRALLNARGHFTLKTVGNLTIGEDSGTMGCLSEESRN